MCNDEGRSQTERSQVVSDSVIDEKMDNEYKKMFHELTVMWIR